MNQILQGLRWEPDDGALYFGQSRYLLIRPETVMALQKDLVARFGAGALAAFLAGGKAGGRSAAQAFADQADSPAGVIGFLSRMGGQIGWGALKLTAMDAAAGSFTIEVGASPWAEAYGPADEPVCRFLQGVFHGAAEMLFAGTVVSAETHCAALGHDRCRIVITTES